MNKGQGPTKLFSRMKPLRPTSQIERKISSMVFSLRPPSSSSTGAGSIGALFLLAKTARGWRLKLGVAVDHGSRVLVLVTEATGTGFLAVVDADVRRSALLDDDDGTNADADEATEKRAIMKICDFMFAVLSVVSVLSVVYAD